MLRNKYFIIGFLLGTSLTLSSAELAKGNLIANGDFSKIGDAGKIEAWQVGKNAKVEKIDGKPTLVLNGNYSGIKQNISLKPDWHTLHLSMRMKATNIKIGNASWKDGRVAMCFKNADGKRIGEWPKVFNVKGTSEWQNCERDYSIPSGAAILEFNPVNFGKSGKLELRDIRLTLIKLRVPLKDLALPKGASNVWTPEKSQVQKSATREQLCINGLWRFLPIIDAYNKTIPVAGKGWGWFKIPGIWPTAKDWDISAPSQEFLLPEQIKEKVDLKTLEQAWYQREITIPATWTGKKILLDFEMVQTHSAIYIDGKQVGEILFPGGEVDITSAVLPGRKAVLTILHTARALAKAADVFMAPGRVFKTKTKLKMKGITGDVYLLARPEIDYITDTHIITSTRKQEISFDSGLAGLKTGDFQLTAEILIDNKSVKTFKSKIFSKKDLQGHRFRFTAPWKDPLLWDTHTPDKLYTAKVTLKKQDGTIVDQQIPFQFGFREFWIDGRDFYLNGKRIHLRALTVSNICDFADKASFLGALNTCTKMKEYGFNFLITNNYNFLPGAVSYMNGLFQATRKTGVLASFSLPHAKDYNWFDTKEQEKRYQKLCQWLIRKVQNNPSIIAYAMNHNATGYYGDQNPLKIDGIYSLEKISATSKSKLKYRKQAMLSAKIAKGIDSSRPVYHHQSGNLGDMYTLNCYLNWAPRQERSDWLQHWSKKGVKPIFFVEWGLPHIASWSSYRGPNFIWRSIEFQKIWDSEFASAITNQKAYKMSKEKENILAQESKFWDNKKPIHWGLLAWFLSKSEHNYLEIQSWFAADNWRSFRMAGASAMLPWDQQGMWKRISKTKNKQNPECYANLQRPGIVPDFFTQGSQYIYERQKRIFEPTSLGKTFLRWNQSVIAFIAGKKAHPTEKNCTFTHGENINKQLVIVNDSREKRTCNYTWELKGMDKKGEGSIDIAPGDVGFVPLSILIEDDVSQGQYKLSVAFNFMNGKKQNDTFVLNVIGIAPEKSKIKLRGKIALFDPSGETKSMLENIKISFTNVDANSDLKPYRMLIIGKNALVEKNSLIDFAKVKHKMNILVFEQPYKVLSQRLGFRANIMGLRNTFIRNSIHPALKGISDKLLKNWRGASTLTSPYLQNLPEFETHDPKWNWCGFLNTRVWRAGNNGNTASVLIEKPVRGNWMPLIDGGFNLQYSPLLEYRDQKGVIIFCQMDTTSRTELEPVASMLYRNLIFYLDTVNLVPSRTVYYTGNDVGEKLLKQLGIIFTIYDNQLLNEKSLLIVGPEAKLKTKLFELVKGGANALCLGLNAVEINANVSTDIKVKDSSEYSSMIEDLSTPEFMGISNSELYWRTKMHLAAIQNNDKYSNKALKKISSGNGIIILSQLAPWMIDYMKSPNIRNTYRRNIFLVSRLLANLGAVYKTSKLRESFKQPLLQNQYKLPTKWVALESPNGDGEEKQWHKSTFDDSAWKGIKVPGAFENQRKELIDYNGYFWYRIKFKAPGNLKNSEVTLNIGPVDDESWVWLNDNYMGEVTKKTNPKDYYRADRIYKLKPGQLKFDGENTLVVRVADWYKMGGIMGDPMLTVPQKSLDSYYIQKPIADDDPYRYYRW